MKETAAIRPLELKPRNIAARFAALRTSVPKLPETLGTNDASTTDLNTFASAVGAAATARFSPHVNVMTGHLTLGGGGQDVFFGNLSGLEYVSIDPARTRSLSGDWHFLAVNYVSAGTGWTITLPLTTDALAVTTELVTSSAVEKSVAESLQAVQFAAAWPLTSDAATEEAPDVTRRVIQDLWVARATSTPTATESSLLIRAARSTFPQASFLTSNETDPEEGWTRPTLHVHTGIDDLDVRMALEEKFYANVLQHETLTAALQKVTVIFE